MLLGADVEARAAAAGTLGESKSDWVNDLVQQIVQRAEHCRERLAPQRVGIDEAHLHRMAHQARRQGVLHGETDAAMAHVLPGPLRKAGALAVLALKLNRGDAGGMSLHGGRPAHLGALVGLSGAAVAEMHKSLLRPVPCAVPSDLHVPPDMLHP